MICPSLLSRPLLSTLLGATLLSGTALAQAETRPLDVPYVPTPQVVVDRMLAVGQVGADDFVLDLGSGDGRIPVTAASKFGARGLGVDLNPQRIAEANENAQNAGVTDLVEFRQQDLFETDITQATVLTMYLLPSVNMQLRPRILDELPAGTRVVSHAFDMQDWEPDQRDTVEGRSVYLWIVPAKVEGAWQLSGEQNYEIQFNQTFQMLDGTATRNGNTFSIEDGRLRGNRITFTIDGTTYAGTVEDQAIVGDDSAWHALHR